MFGRTGECGLGCSTTARAAADWTSYGPEVGSGKVGCIAAATNSGAVSPPRGRIGIWVSVAANEARGAGNAKVTADPDPVTLTPRSAVASVGSLASAESANRTVATTSAIVISAPSDHWTFGGSTTS